MDTKISSEKEKNIILEILKDKGQINSKELSEELNIDHQRIIGIINALEIKEVIKTEPIEKSIIVLTDSGKNCLEKGAPDIQILKELKEKGDQTKEELSSKLGKNILSQGFNLAMKSKSISYDKKTDKIGLKISELPIKDELQETIKKFSEFPDMDKYDQNLIKQYSKIYKFIKINQQKSFILKPGKNFEIGNIKMKNELTTELLVNNQYEKEKFS